MEMWVCFWFGGGKWGNLGLIVSTYSLKYEEELSSESEGGSKREGGDLRKRAKYVIVVSGQEKMSLPKKQRCLLEVYGYKFKRTH